MRVLVAGLIGSLCLSLTSCERSGSSVDRTSELIVGRWQRTDQPGDAKDVIEFTADGKYKGVKSTRVYKLPANDVIVLADADGDHVSINRLTVTRTELTLTLVVEGRPVQNRTETYRRLE
jgi:hypothetical protein